MKIIINIILALLVFSCNNEKSAEDVVVPAEVKKTFIDSNTNSKPVIDSSINNAYTKARNDLSSNHGKYYAFGIAGPPKQYIDSMKMKYNLEVVSVGCTPDNDMIYYNKIIDSFIKNRKLLLSSETSKTNN